jgi:hypothetical protein
MSTTEKNEAQVPHPSSCQSLPPASVQQPRAMLLNEDGLPDYKAQSQSIRCLQVIADSENQRREGVSAVNTNTDSVDSLYDGKISNVRCPQPTGTSESLQSQRFLHQMSHHVNNNIPIKLAPTTAEANTAALVSFDPDDRGPMFKAQMNSFIGTPNDIPVATATLIHPCYSNSTMPEHPYGANDNDNDEATNQFYGYSTTTTELPRTSRPQHHNTVTTERCEQPQQVPYRGIRHAPRQQSMFAVRQSIVVQTMMGWHKERKYLYYTICGILLLVVVLIIALIATVALVFIK